MGTDTIVLLALTTQRRRTQLHAAQKEPRERLGFTGLSYSG